MQGREVEEVTFDEALQVLKELKRADDLFMVMMPPFGVEFQVDEETLKEHNVAPHQFKRTAGRVAGALFAVLDGSEEEYISYRIERAGVKGEEAERERERVTARLASVREALVDPHLEKRYALKKSSKAPAFMDVDWDIKFKVLDAETTVEFPYATCKIKFQREFEASPVTIVSGRLFDAVQLNFTLDEVRYLAKVFGVIGGHLETLERQGWRREES